MLGLIGPQGGMLKSAFRASDVLYENAHRKERKSGRVATTLTSLIQFLGVGIGKPVVAYNAAFCPAHTNFCDQHGSMYITIEQTRDETQ